MRFLPFTCALILLALAASAADRTPRGEPGKFDSYLLALSWSPAYCESRPGDAQCAPGRKFAFVVHGLWPQYNNGRWPEFCSTAPGLKNPDAMLDLMPSRSLIRHEWEKHGTCSGLSADGYFALIRKTYQSVRIPQRFTNPAKWMVISPAEVKREFVAANPKLRDSMVSVQCSSNMLSEVRICLGRDGTPIPCTGQRDCRAAQVRMPPVR